MQCPKCGYVMQQWESECPRCKVKGVEKKEPGAAAPQPLEPQPTASESPEVQQPATPAQTPDKPKAGKGELALNGILAGAIYGVIFLVVFVLIDRFLFGGGELARPIGILVALIVGAIAGAVIGAIIGLVTVMTRSMWSGIAVGAVVVAIIHGVGVSGAGLRGGFTIMALLVGAIYGALMGWVVASSVMGSIKWDKVA